MLEENISVYISSGCFSDNNSFLIFSRVKTNPTFRKWIKSNSGNLKIIPIFKYTMSTLLVIYNQSFLMKKKLLLVFGAAISTAMINPLNANLTKWSNTLTQFVGNWRLKG